MGSITSLSGLKALPPQAQMAREIKTIQEDARFKEFLKNLGQNNAVDISKTAVLEGRVQYTVTADNGDVLKVDVVYDRFEKPMFCGPIPFHLEFSDR